MPAGKLNIVFQVSHLRHTTVSWYCYPSLFSISPSSFNLWLPRHIFILLLPLIDIPTVFLLWLPATYSFFCYQFFFYPQQLCDCDVWIIGPSMLCKTVIVNWIEAQSSEKHEHTKQNGGCGVGAPRIIKVLTNVIWTELYTLLNFFMSIHVLVQT